MLADMDNPLEADPESDQVGTPEPKLLVVYRSRGVPWLLIPPLLLVAAVAANIVYRRSERPEFPMVIPSGPTLAAAGPLAATPGVSTSGREISRYPAPDLSARPTVPGETTPTTELPPPTAIEAPPAVPPVVAALTPPVEPKPDAVAGPFARPPDEVRRDPVGFDPEAAKVAAAALIAPKAVETKVPENIASRERIDSTPPLIARGGRPPSDEALADAQREAERRLAEQAGLAAAKPDLLNPDPREVTNQRHELISSSRRLAAQARGPFHAEVRQLLAEQGNGAGPMIQRLCNSNRYGRDTLPEILGPMNKDLVGPASRLSLPGRIKRMRSWGVPETMILDDLVEAEITNYKARGGPRSEAEAWVRAARVLLANPPAKPLAPASRTATATPSGL